MHGHVVYNTCAGFHTHHCLQGEHGTGRNVAPFVEMEWGTKAYDLMWELKALFDPNFVLNPGVVLNKVGPFATVSGEPFLACMLCCVPKFL